MAGTATLVIRGNHPHVSGDLARNLFEQCETGRVNTIVVNEQDPLLGGWVGHARQYTGFGQRYLRSKRIIVGAGFVITIERNGVRIEFV